MDHHPIRNLVEPLQQRGNPLRIYMMLKLDMRPFIIQNIATKCLTFTDEIRDFTVEILCSDRKLSKQRQRHTSIILPTILSFPFLFFFLSILVLVSRDIFTLLFSTYIYNFISSFPALFSILHPVELITSKLT